MSAAGQYRCGSCGNKSGPGLNAEGWVRVSFVPLVWIDLFGDYTADPRQREQTSHSTVCGDCMANLGLHDLGRQVAT